MKNIRFLSVRFQAEIEAYEIPAFRGAVVKKAGPEHILFHNHMGNQGFRYAYPVIQYKRIGRNPAIVCVDCGIDEIHHFFNNPNLDIEISGRQILLDVKKLQLNQHTLQVWERSFALRLSHWLALNQENHARYLATNDELARLTLLEGILKANVLSFAKGVGWDVDREISLRIDRIARVRPVIFKEQKLLAFDVDFRTNVLLPDYLGLGKGVSHGFGIVQRARRERND